jgi:hypothetical protein
VDHQQLELLTAAVYEKGFFASCRMSADQRMLRGNRLTPYDPTSLLASFSLFDSRVDCFQAMESLLQQWRQPVVSFDVIYKCSIATDLRGVEYVQESGAGRLILVSDITKVNE